MIGHVDEFLRALVSLKVGPSAAELTTEITAWIDTAFNGFFVFSKDRIVELGLQREALTQAILADGSQVTLESYVCYVNWFDRVVAAQVIANEGKFPLLGTEFMAGHKLFVDYSEGQVSVE